MNPHIHTCIFMLLHNKCVYDMTSTTTHMVRKSRVWAVCYHFPKKSGSFDRTKGALLRKYRALLKCAAYVQTGGCGGAGEFGAKSF